MIRSAERYPLFPYTTLFRSVWGGSGPFIVRNTSCLGTFGLVENLGGGLFDIQSDQAMYNDYNCGSNRSEEHTSELQSHVKIVSSTMLDTYSNSGAVAALQGT